MKKDFIYLFIVGLLFTKNLASQNKQVLYGFDAIPQTLLLNPGANTNYKYHMGVPVLSGLSFNAGVTGITAADLFRNNNVDFTTKLLSAIDNLTENDYIHINAQIEILNGGYKLNKKDYLSVGFYTELDAFLNIPKDLLVFLKDGNSAYLNNSFLLSQGSLKVETVGVLHAGLSRKVNDKLTVGARVKIYSGIFNATSTNNEGTFTTNLNESNQYIHSLNNINTSIHSSGFYDENDKRIKISDLTGRALLSSNIGLGIDVGFTYKLDKQTEISASLLDIGFINYSEDILSSEIVGAYTFSGVNFQFDGTNNDYFKNLNEDFKAKVPSEENRKSYTVMRPLKFNSSYKYSWGRSRNEKDCSDMSFKDFYNNSLGAQLFSVFRPSGLKLALTGFYERKLSSNFNTKITYTIDDFSSSNVGIGISTRIGKVNVYGMLDNLFKITDIADANSLSFQLGINLIYN